MYVPDECSPWKKVIFFVTHLSSKTSCTQVQIPYFRRLSGAILPFTSSRKRTVLASFVGSSTTYVKRSQLRKLLQYEGYRIVFTDAFWKDTVKSSDAIERIEAKHDILISKSIFGLCPRGHGVSSMRVVENMMGGSIPVLIDDTMMPFGRRFDFAVYWNFNGKDSMKALDLHLRSFSSQNLSDMRTRMSHYVKTVLLSDSSWATPTALKVLPFSQYLVERYISPLLAL